MNINIKTWQARTGNHNIRPGSVKHMLAEIAELRAALAEAQAKITELEVAGCADSYALQSAIATQAPSVPAILTPTLEDFLASTMPPKGYEGCSVIERNGQLIWLRKEDRLPTDLICFFDGDCRDVLTPYDSRVQPPIKLAPSAPVDVCAEMRALCSACGGTGDVHSTDGEWRGSCDCQASTPVAPDERAAFEVEERKNTSNLSRQPDGQYENPCTQSAWEGWQARSALSVQAGSYPEIPEGWALLPKQATDDMVVAFAEAWYSRQQAIDDPDMEEAYAAMLAAAPTPPTTGEA